MSFKVGDRVVVCGDRCPDEVGLTAIIRRDRKQGAGQFGLRYLVEFEATCQHHPYFGGTVPSGEVNSYDAQDLRLVPVTVMDNTAAVEEYEDTMKGISILSDILKDQTSP